MSSGLVSAHFRLDFSQDTGRLAAADPGDVVLVFEQHTHGRIGLRRVDRHAVQLDQRLRPVDGFRHAGGLEQVRPPKPLHEPDDLLAKRRAGLGRLAATVG